MTDVVRRVRLSEYKRRQMPPGLKITGKAYRVPTRTGSIVEINAILGKQATTTRLAAVKAETAQRLNRDDIEIGLGLRIRFSGFTQQKAVKSHGLTIPRRQWPFWRQPARIGSITLTLSRTRQQRGAQLWLHQDHRVSDDYIA